MEYTNSELSSVMDTVTFLRDSQEALAQADAKSSVKSILEKFTSDENLQAFLSSNLQPKEGGGFAWKYHVDPLYDNISSVLSFNPSSTFSGPTVIVKAGSSDFVKTKHVSAIKAVFPDYRFVMIST